MFCGVTSAGILASIRGRRRPPTLTCWSAEAARRAFTMRSDLRPFAPLKCVCPTLRVPLLASLALAALLTSHAHGQQKPRQPVVLDRIIAVVNDEAITARELEERGRFAMKQLAQQGTPPPPKAVVERQILERMVADRVQLQFAKETGLRVDDAELERAIERIAEQNKISVPALRSTLEKDGVPYAKFREDIRNEIIMSRLRE